MVNNSSLTEIEKEIMNKEIQLAHKPDESEEIDEIRSETNDNTSNDKKLKHNRY